MPSLRTVRVLLVVVGLAAWVVPQGALGAAGDLDPSFGAGGIVITTLGSMEDRAHAGLLQPDGKIIAGGGKFTGSTTADMVLVRYQPNGIPDPTFGTGGLVTTSPGGSAEVVSLALQPDGKIVAAGNTYTGTEYELVLARYETDGTPDATFGVGGMVISSIGPGRGFTRKVLLLADGKILVIGDVNPGSPQLAFARYEADGSVDGGFGIGGEVFSDLPSSTENSFDAHLLADGRFIVAGYANLDMMIARFLADGSLDPSFGSGGFTPVPGTDFGYALAVQPDGKYVMSGTTPHTGGTYDYTIVRWNTDGTIDTSFGTGGVVFTPVGPKDDFPYAVGVQASGKIVAVGQVDTGAFFTSDFGVVRYEPDGTLDVSFGTGGITRTSLGAFSFAAPEDVLIQPDGRIVAVGARPAFGPRHFALTRYFGNVCGDGALEVGEDCDDGNTAAGDCCSPTCTFEAAGTACTTDGDACTNDLCDATGTCAHPAVTCALCDVCDSSLGCYGGPRAGCLGADPVGQSSLQIRDRSPDTRDLVRWKWRSGTVALGDFGDPLHTDDYALCIYQGPSLSLWRRNLAPADGTCGSGRPCWKPLAPAGAKYADRELTPNGIASLVLRSNVPGQVQLKLKGKGVQLGLPPLMTLVLPVRVQLQREGGVCWDVTYGTARTSTAQVFDARTQ